MTPEGAGNKDGSNWENALAGNGTGLADAWRALNSNGTLYLGSGTYEITAELNSSASGKSYGEMKRLVGVDTGSGYPFLNCNGGAFMTIPQGTSNIWIENISVDNVYNGISIKGKNKNIRLYNVDISNAKNGSGGGHGIIISGGISGTDPLTDATNDIILKDCDIKYCAKGLLRFENGVYNVRLFNCTFDNGGSEVYSTFTNPWVIGIRFESGAKFHGIVFTDCVIRNVYQGASGGTGVDIKDAYNISFIRTKFMDNNGWAVEEKSGAVTFIDCVFLRNRGGIYFGGPAEITSLMYRTLNAYSMEKGIEVASSAQVEIYNSTIYDGNIKNNGYLKFVNSIISSSSGGLFEAGSGLTEKYNTVEYVPGVSDESLNPDFINPHADWDGEGNDFDSITYGTAKGFYYRGAEVPSESQPQPGDFIRERTDAEISLQGFVPGEGEAIYVTPEGAGLKDGSSWENAIEGNKAGGLQAAWDAMMASGAKDVMIGSGNYDVEQTLVIEEGGTDIKNMKRIIGVDTGDGFPVFTGNFTLDNQTGNPLIILNDGANYIWIQDLKVNNYNQFLQANQRHKGLRIYNVDTNLTRIAMHFEGINDNSSPDSGSRDTIIMDCEQLNYTIRDIRFRYGNSLGWLINCKSDAGSEGNWAAGNFPMGFTIGDSQAANNQNVRDTGFVFIECEGHNAWQDAGGNYWNGDGFNAEKCANDLVYFACKAYNSSDGGWDDKAYNPTLIDCVAIRNKRNYRFWSEGTAVLYNCLSAYARNFGSRTDALGLWTGEYNNPNTEVFNSTFHDTASGAEIAAVAGSTIRVHDSVISSSVDKDLVSGDVQLFNSVTYTPSGGTDPVYVNGSNKFWLGEGDDFNSTVFGPSKGYMYMGIYKGVTGLTFPAIKTVLYQKLQETADAVEEENTPESWALFVAARERAIAVYNDPSATQDEVDEAVIELMNAYHNLTGIAPKPYTIQGTLFREGIGIKAEVNVNLTGFAPEGKQVIVFKLSKGTTPLSIIALEEYVTSSKALVGFFNAADPENPDYKVTVYILDGLTDDLLSVPESLAAPLILE